MKRLIITLTIIFITLVQLQGQDFGDSVSKFMVNQGKIKTLTGTGKMTIKMEGLKTRSGKQNPGLENMESDIFLYVKAPDKFKLITDGMTRSTIIQNGDTILKQIKGFGNAKTEKVNDTNNLLKQYLTFDMENIKKNATLLLSKVITEKGQKLFKYRIKMNNQALTAEYGQMFNIDYSDLYFTPTGILIKNITYVNKQPLVTITFKHEKQNNIYVVKEIKTATKMGKINMENTITYNSIEVNKKVKTSEFNID